MRPAAAIAQPPLRSFAVLQAVEIGGEASPVDPGEAGDINESITLVPSGVAIEGGTIIGADAIRPLYEPQLAAEVAFGDMLALARAITVNHRNAGYSLARAFIPVI